jgi:hypothetical protein
MMKFRGLSKSSLIYLPILQLISFKAVLISGSSHIDEMLAFCDFWKNWDLRVILYMFIYD